MKTLREIEERKKEIRSILESEKECDLDALKKELEDLEERKAQIEERKEIAKQIQKGEVSAKSIYESKEEQREYGIDSEEYRSAFLKTIAGVGLNEVEQRAMTTNTGSAGVAVPTITMNKIYEKIEETSVVYNLVTVSHLSGNVSIPIEKLTHDVERKAEGTDGTLQDDTLAELKLGAKKYIKLIRLTCELENTAIDALENFIVAKLSKKLMQAFDADIINGTGTNGAKGIIPTLASATIETATQKVIDYDDICDLFAKINATAKKNAKLVMSTQTLYGKVKKIKDADKRPIFDPNQNKILGRDIVECDDVPDGYILFGDFSEYMFNWSKDAQIEKSNQVGFASGDVVYRILALADGGLADLGAMAVLKEKQGA